MNPTVRLMPSLTPPSPMTNGTTRIATSTAPRLGPRARTRTVHPPTATPLPLTTARATARATVSPRPLLTTALPRATTETMHGPSRLTAMMQTQDTASLTIPLKPSLTTTSPTQRGLRPPIISGLRARSPRMSTLTMNITQTMTTTQTMNTTPGEEIRSTKRISPTIRPTPNPMVLNLTMNGTTPTTANGEPNLGTRERMPTEPLLTANLPPQERTILTAIMIVMTTTMTKTRPPTTTKPPRNPRTMMLGPRLATVPTRMPDTASPTTL